MKLGEKPDSAARVLTDMPSSSRRFRTSSPRGTVVFRFSSIGVIASPEFTETCLEKALNGKSPRPNRVEPELSADGSNTLMESLCQVNSILGTAAEWNRIMQ